MSFAAKNPPAPRRPMEVPASHFVLGNQLQPPFPGGLETAIFGMGCFWGVERRFWELDGVYTTAAGYAGGVPAHPDYREVCTGDTGHAEVVLVVFDPAILSYAQLLRAFWEGHDPTQGFRQGNDVGSQYRSVIFTTSQSQYDAASSSRDAYERQLELASHGRITTEVVPAPEFYYAEAAHQQYLAKNPGGYCGGGGTGVSCTIPAQE